MEMAISFTQKSAKFKLNLLSLNNMSFAGLSNEGVNKTMIKYINVLCEQYTFYD